MLSRLVSVAWYGEILTEWGLSVILLLVSVTLIGYARCFTDEQDLIAQCQRLGELGVTEDRIYLDHGLTGTRRARPGLDQALAAMRAGDTLVVPKLDRLARSVPDARAIGDDLAARNVKLSLGGQVYDSTDLLPRSLPLAQATAMPSRVRILSRSTSNSAKVARMLKNILPIVYRTLQRGNRSTGTSS